MTLWFLLVYLGLQAALAAWVSRGIRSEADFLVAGRRISTPLLAVSMFATWFGAETCLGASGAVYTSGLAGARADPLGYGLCLLLMGVLLAARLWRGGFITLGDVYRRRYGVRIERLAVMVLVPSSIIWGAAQVRAFGQVVSSTMNIEVTLAVYCSALFVVGYTFVGGLAGDVVTDFVQGLVVATGLLGLVVCAVVSQGGILAAASAIDPERLTMWVSGEDPWAQVDRWAIPVLGSLVGQELIARVLASKSADSARNASVFACVLYLLVGSSPVLLGLLGPSLVPKLGEPEQLLPTLARQLLPGFLFAVFSCALLSAILSTINSVLLACAGLLSHNLIVPMLGLETDRHRLLSVRLLVVVSGALSLWIALHTEGVYELVEMASAFGTAGVVVTTLAALFSPWGNGLSATLALVAGLVATPVAEQFGAPAPFLTSLAVAAFGYAAGVVISPARHPSTLVSKQLAVGVTDRSS